MPAQVEHISQGEALTRFLAGGLVDSLTMIARFEMDGRYSVSERELLSPESWPREEGLPVVMVEGVDAPFFNPHAALDFMTEWLRMTPEEIAEEEEQKRQEAAEDEAREAKIRHELEHPSPERRIDATDALCRVAGIRLKEGLTDEDASVRDAAVTSGMALLKGLADVLSVGVADVR